MDKFKNAFREEADELLVQLEGLLLELETNPADVDVLNATFRAVHTIKGSAGMFGFERISRFVHDFESLLDECRVGRLQADSSVVGLFLRARDIVKEMLAEDDDSAPFSAEGLEIIGAFKQLVDKHRAAAPVQTGSAPAPGANESAVSAAGSSAPGGSPVPVGAALIGGSAPNQPPRPVSHGNATQESYRLMLKPAAGIFFTGTRVFKLLAELASLGELQAFPRLREIPDLEDINPEFCYVAWDLILVTAQGLNAIKDVFIFVEGSVELKIEKIANPDEGTPGETKKLGEILVERGLVQLTDLGDALKSQRRLGDVLIQNRLVSQAELDAALAEQAHVRKSQEKTSENSASIRVASEKLDLLVDLVGEMVTLQARLAQTSSEVADAGLSAISEQLERLVSQLRDNAMSIRMLPIGSTFNKFKRVVRDLSAELGKDVDLLTEGAETELDKTVIERLNDPLVHIIRNALDHGLERPEVRQAAGKAVRGSLTLRAEQSGAHVIISVSDDGNGLDVDAIQAKALERGLIGPGENLTEEEAFMLVFRPGFSTAKNVSSVSGRGVGMDVVKREIDSLGGAVSIVSRRGQGSTIFLKIPLTLAIIEGLLVRISQEYYVLPLAPVEACVELDSQAAGSNEGRLMQYRGDLLPYVDLREFFSVPGEAPLVRQVVVVNSQNERIGLVVDTVIGDHQTVIKPLGRMLRGVEGLSGATILGNGTVALIIDHGRIALKVRTGALRGRL
ncbi:MAG: hypothetical protein A2087_14280 [Spirochaetes bacterium GWD1_61_31]|nr:MAG: hypothetical protein A2Y37_04170 [Spirochaetes bacterium GWB1_60_80]OHD30598.1 MAG: hypothetical protein A2004_05555 [Spirochaetes bacterium GWC1_61_12]OHD34868.1 MAG: hypothetical protein A2087_14280 [Spirochaetes bacterium GWD1_61_31]OHD46715.1 MAG: hypothetical protein A2Y35_11105 [Spirochaetes bacterium GWE1_60_18]OHD60342.1 MAG: hypothetical protein A2Y32_14670 [Spirochaetes bacterium GWF1_60_12]HAP44216.1 chemotaxis protein CheA [Spirochaetaceae bacterium]